MKLYEIAQEIEEAILAHVDPETGEITDAGIAALEELEGKLEEKALHVAAYIKGERAEAEAIREEERRLAQRRKAIENRAARLEEYLRHHIAAGTKLHDSRVEIGWRRSAKCEVLDEDLIPPDFRVPQPDKINLGEAKKAIKAGMIVPGLTLTDHMHIQIR